MPAPLGAAPVGRNAGDISASAASLIGHHFYNKHSSCCVLSVKNNSLKLHLHLWGGGVEFAIVFFTLVLQMRKLRYREVGNLPKDTQFLSDRGGLQTHVVWCHVV